MEIPHYYARMIYLDRIKPFIDTQIIKVLVGQRRVGKSFMLFQLMDYIRGKNANADILYINKELFEFDSLRDYTDLMYYIQKHREGKTGKCYLFIDEVQDIISFEKALRGLLADGRYDIYCTRSNARMLSGELATFLSGRYVEFRIWGLNYSEFMQFHQLEDSDETFSRYYKFGGLPYLVNLPFDEGIVSEYLRGIYNTILLKDIVDRYGIRNVRQLQDLTVYLADTIGNMFSASSISEYLKSQRIDLTPKMILEYLGYLENAFFVRRVRPVDIQGKKQFRIGEKYYFEDLGIRHVLRPFRPNDIGQVLENVVYHHLMVCGYTVHVGRDGDREVDFVAERDGEKLYVQVATSVMEQKTWEREYGNLLGIRDNYPKIVVTLDPLEGASFQGIRQIPVRRFLLMNN